MVVTIRNEVDGPSFEGDIIKVLAESLITFFFKVPDSPYSDNNNSFLLPVIVL